MVLGKTILLEPYYVDRPSVSHAAEPEFATAARGTRHGLTEPFRLVVGICQSKFGWCPYAADSLPVKC